MSLRTTHYAPRLVRLRSFLLLTLLLAFALRTYRLDFQELRGDEAFGYFFSLRTFDDIVESTLRLQEPHPVASYFVQKGWLSWAGASEFALRLVSVWFGVLAVALLYRLGRQLELGRGVSTVAAALLALSPYAVWHSQDARMYTMSLALTLASSWLAVEWQQRQRWPWAVAYLGVSWLALHTHYFSVFVLLAQSLFLLSRTLILPRLRFILSSWLSLQVILGLLYLPWLVPALQTLTGYGGNGDSPSFFGMVQRSLSVFAVGESTPLTQRNWWAALAALLLLSATIHLIQTSNSTRRSLWFLALYLCVPLLVTWYSAQQRPIFNERYLIAAAPPFYLLIASGLRVARVRSSLLTPRPRVTPGSLAIPSFCQLVLLLALAAGMLLSLHRHYADSAYSKTRGWRELAAALERFSAQMPPEQVRLAQNFPDPTLWYYYAGSVEHLVLPSSAHDQEGAIVAVDAMADKGVQRVVLPLQAAPNWDDQGIAQAALAQRYTLAAETQVAGWPVQLYALPPVELTPLNVNFQNGLTLTGMAVQPEQLAPGDYLTVHLGWRGSNERLGGTEKVFVQLLNESGQLVAQDDRPLTRAELAATVDSLAIYAILLPADLSPGTYRLIVGLYDPARPGAPRILTVDGSDFVVIQEYG